MRASAEKQFLLQSDQQAPITGADRFILKMTPEEEGFKQLIELTKGEQHQQCLWTNSFEATQIRQVEFKKRPIGNQRLKISAFGITSL